jgi:hypothetical protein
VRRAWAVYQRTSDGLLKRPEYDYNIQPFDCSYTSEELAWEDIVNIAKRWNVDDLIVVEEVDVVYFDPGDD